MYLGWAKKPVTFFFFFFFANKLYLGLYAPLNAPLLGQNVCPSKIFFSVGQSGVTTATLRSNTNLVVMDHARDEVNHKSLVYEAAGVVPFT